jgi:hypothetical protein
MSSHDPLATRCLTFSIKPTITGEEVVLRPFAWPVQCVLLQRELNRLWQTLSSTACKIQQPCPGRPTLTRVRVRLSR